MSMNRRKWKSWARRSARAQVRRRQLWVLAGQERTLTQAAVHLASALFRQSDEAVLEARARRDY